jgi:hypothetical protein
MMAQGGHPMFLPVGYGVVSTPWQALQRAASAVLRKTEMEL